MDFPSMEWMKALQEKCNAHNDFSTATMWSDVKIVLAFGEMRYWLKLYKGKIIDLSEYLRDHPLGYDIIVSGPMEVWNEIREGRVNFWAAAMAGMILIDGNQLECNRMHEAICIMCMDLLPEVK
jgi:putative sterol carrier protein